MKPQSPILSSSGNAFFIILLTIGLFAALTYAVVNASRSTDITDMSDEQAILDAGVERQCNTAVRTGVNMLKVRNECSNDQISYELADGSNENPNAPADRRCHVFDQAGAGLTPCGQYLEVTGPTITTGPIAWGDTNTWVSVGAGVYARCNSFNNSDPLTPFCDLSYSTDGSSQVQICAYNGAYHDGEFNFRVNFCSAACGPPNHSGYLDQDFPGSVSGGYIINPGGAISPYTGPCSGGNMARIGCDCWL